MGRNPRPTRKFAVQLTTTAIEVAVGRPAKCDEKYGYIGFLFALCDDKYGHIGFLFLIGQMTNVAR